MRRQIIWKRKNSNFLISSLLINDCYPRNREITVLEMADEVMLSETGPGRSLLVQRMLRKGVSLICKAKVTRVEEDKIYYEKDGEEHCIVDADTLVFAAGYRINPQMEETLKRAGVNYQLIGDAQKVGNIKDAIHAGYETGIRM